MIVLAFVGQVAFVPAVAAQQAPSTEPAQDRVTTIRDNGAPAQSPQPPANTDNVIRDGGPAPSAAPPSAPPAPAPGPAAPPADIGSPPDAPSPGGGAAAGFGPDDPSIFGWPASIGGIPRNIPAGSARCRSTATPLTRLDAGLDASLGTYSAIVGSIWHADSEFSWDSVPTGPRDPALDILGTDDDALYLSQRRATLKTCAFGYQIAVPQPATYTVRLHFTELW